MKRRANNAQDEKERIKGEPFDNRSVHENDVATLLRPQI